ncbi:MAG: DUF72 domain-containing protein [Deltaproteobacteria bacterium]|nr:DUF72 domain-containing protein [Deltaproteobacteria bacterium]
MRRLSEESAPLRIGTVDIPARVERERYFSELSYLELSVLFAGPAKPSVLAKWADETPDDAIGLVAPFPLTHRKPPVSTKLWPHDASTGEFRDSPVSRATLAPLTAATAQLKASYVVFRSPESFSPSAANRDQLKRFFGEVAVMDVPRVWVPGGLWNVRTAVKLANELGVTCAFDPLVRDPGEPPEIHYDLEADSLYLRIEGAGRTGTLRAEKLDELADLVASYEDRELTVVFASPERWSDARNFKKLLNED